MDSLQREPARLSALYQYHNAPEVAPAHGLEYDDTIYSTSDKYPVTREPPLYHAKFVGNPPFYGDGSNRPPRIVFGMKIQTFLLVALVMTLIVVGAAVGGAVGGKQLREQHDMELFAYGTNTALPATAANKTAASAASTTSTFAAATPTYVPLDDCPASNNTTYTSQYPQYKANSTTSSLQFTKQCDLENPLITTGGQHIAEAFVYTFSDCVELCAAYNYLNSGNDCSVAVYDPTANRPGNCWIGDLGELQPPNNPNTIQGTHVAFLHHQ